MSRKDEGVGGQAVYEGVMMRRGVDVAVAVRDPDGHIVVQKQRLQPFFKKWTKIPFLRGIMTLLDSLFWGIKALNYSTTVAFEEEEESDSGWEIVVALILGFALFVALFIVLPLLIVKPVENYISSAAVLKLLEGIVRLVIFVVYLYLISKMKDIYRVFQYHGAEHKTVFCYEAGEELTVENCRKYPRFHPRCGTSFLLVVMIVSIVIFAFLGEQTFLLRIVTRILLIPVVFSISYEIIRIGAKYSDSWFWKIILFPGLWLQYFTTKEPDDSQLETAIVALKEVTMEEDASENSN
ncbi:MAG TPA: DUF1385 domain-containing protein [Dictyoglomaceae bacterium]|nr:DUF1385 domain-containing protein [Dictyoglomaceae bacterium]